jgi:hypothetical protein
MMLEVKRLDSDGRYETIIARDDGVSFHIQGVAHTFAIPHDLAHYLIEKSLGIEHGFWGLIARGAVFPTMTYLDGRRKPKATERSAQLMKRHARDLVEAEIVVRILNDAFEEGYGQTPSVIEHRLNERLPNWRRIDSSAVAATYARYKKLKHDWDRLPARSVLSRQW